MTNISARRHGAWLMALLIIVAMMPIDATAGTISLFGDPVTAAGFVPDPSWDGQPNSLGQNYTEVSFTSSNSKTLTVGVFQKDGIWHLLISRNVSDGSANSHNIIKIVLTYGATNQTITGVPPYVDWNEQGGFAYYALAIGTDIPYQIGVFIDTGSPGHNTTGTLTLGTPGSIVVRHVLETPGGSHTYQIQVFTSQSTGDTSATINQIGPVNYGGWTYDYSHADAPISSLPYAALYASSVKNYTLYYSIHQEYLDISGEKAWILPSGMTKPAITIRLLQDGAVFQAKDFIENAADYSYSFSNLPKYAVGPGGDGHEYSYAIAEPTVAGFTSLVIGTDVTNTVEQDYTSVSGEKTWLDGYGQTPGQRPDATVNLWRDNAAPLTGDTPYLTATISNGAQSYSFANLPKYAIDSDGHEYSYTVTEASVDGYRSAQDGLHFTNTKIIDITVTKSWDFGVNPSPDSPIPTSVHVTLTADDAVVGDATLDAGNGWSTGWNGLDEYTEAGGKIHYAVREDALTGFDAAYGSSDTETGVLLTVTNALKYFTVTFVDYNGTILFQTEVPYGGSTTPPGDPGRAGYTFSGWNGGVWINVTSDQIIRANYDPIQELTIIPELGIPLAGGTVANVGDTFD